VVGFFTGIVKIIFAIGRFFRRWHRIFHEVDGYGRGSFLIQGLEQFKCGQVADGIIFFSVEVLFILFMVFWGGVDIFNLIPKTVTITEQSGEITTATCLAEHFGSYSYQARPASVYVLIRGLISILIVVAYFIVYCKGITAAYDDYQIVHNFDFRQAHEKHREQNSRFARLNASCPFFVRLGSDRKFFRFLFREFFARPPRL
jgi:hypothetical protein